MDTEKPTAETYMPDPDEETDRGLNTSPLRGPAEGTDEISLKDFLVLVVDDEIDNTVVISLDLQQQGYRVVTASNGEQAVSIASSTNPDIILMDIGMPEMDGLAAARRIREKEELRSVPIIAVTAFGTEGFHRAALDAGFDGYLVKPFEFDRLHELMLRLLPVKR